MTQADPSKSSSNPNLKIALGAYSSDFTWLLGKKKYLHLKQSHSCLPLTFSSKSRVLVNDTILFKETTISKKQPSISIKQFISIKKDYLTAFIGSFINCSSIVVEVIRTVFFFFYERYFNYKPHKQNHLTNIQPNIYKKSHLNCPYKHLNCLYKPLKHLEQKLLVTSKK